MTRDPRRRLSLEDRRQLFVQADGRCQRCDHPLGDDWEGAHLLAWAHGGATSLANMEAWCLPCNRSQGADDAIPYPDFRLREWQAEALDITLDQVWRRGSATIHAAPGAGKTRFTGAVYLRMKAAGWVERLVVVVPNSALRSQWRESLGEMRIHLDDEPRDNWMEHRDTDGPVVTYHSLPNAAGAHRSEIERRPTLVVLDEVHHAGDKATWGRAVKQMVGDVTGEVYAVGVLNLTGTLFRSTGSKRISTVRYRTAESDPTKIEAIEDYSVRTAQLVPQYLRPPNVYTYGGGVRLLDTSTTEIVEGDIADLDDVQQKSAVLRDSWSSKDWVDGFVAEAIRMLNLQQEVVGRKEPLKLLYVASTQQAAKRAANTLNQLTNQNFARLVISDEPAADRTLRRAAKERTSLAIVSVRMVTEGFDCPAVATIAYASNVVADLTIAQTMARAMRITEMERQLGKVVPAQILIPDHPGLKAAFNQALVGRMHLIAEDEDARLRAERNGAGSGDIIMPRYQVIDLTSPILHGATVVGAPDGEVSADELADWEVQLAARGVPLTYTPNIVVAARQVPKFPRIYAEDPVESASTRTPADPRTANKMHRQRATTLARWMAGHLDHDDRWDEVSWFQNEANEIAGIPKGGRDQATETQLGLVEAWMTEKIIQHCDAHGCNPPPLLSQED